MNIIGLMQPALLISVHVYMWVVHVQTALWMNERDKDDDGMWRDAEDLRDWVGRWSPLKGRHDTNQCQWHLEAWGRGYFLKVSCAKVNWDSKSECY